MNSCLNTDEEVSLCDRSLLSNINLYDIVHRTQSITVADVAEQQVINEYIEQDVLLSSKKISLSIKTYLVNNLLSDLIIDMNVLSRHDVNLQHDNKILKINDIEISLIYAASEDNKYISFHYASFTSQIKTSKL